MRAFGVLKETLPLLDRLRDAFGSQNSESACRVPFSEIQQRLSGRHPSGGDVHKDRIDGAVKHA